MVDNFRSVEAEAASGCVSALFAGNEALTVARRMLVPFWLAELNYSQQTGMIFKTGHATQEYLFVEAFAHRGRWFAATKDSALGGETSRAIMASSSLRRGTESIVPIVGKDRALALLKSIVQSTPGFAGGQPRVLGLVYLPAITAAYANKKGQRQRVYVAGAGEQFNDLQPKQTALGTTQIHIA